MANAGTYTLTVSKTGCSNQSTVSVVVNPNAVANFGSTLLTPTNVAHGYSFGNSSTNATNYFWDFGDGATSTDPNPTHQYTLEQGTATVTLIAYNVNGCNDTIVYSVNLNVVPNDEEALLYMPNSFTPDGNEFNQFFGPVFNTSVDLQNFNMKIYNRWGQLVFETSDPNIGWDGSFDAKISKAGMYTWTVNFRDKNSEVRKKYEGHVNLLR